VHTDGTNLLKGEGFDRWRVVGSLVAAAQVLSMRDVDDLVFQDVPATQHHRTISAG